MIIEKFHELAAIRSKILQNYQVHPIVAPHVKKVLSQDKQIHGNSFKSLPSEFQQQIIGIIFVSFLSEKSCNQGVSICQRLPKMSLTSEGVSERMKKMSGRSTSVSLSSSSTVSSSSMVGSGSKIVYIFFTGHAQKVMLAEW